jgi:hypothetical protein
LIGIQLCQSIIFSTGTNAVKGLFGRNSDFFFASTEKKKTFEIGGFCLILKH